MKSLKRLFVAFVAAAMMLSTMVTGFAAPFTDVSGQKFESSVSKLQQLGVFVGKGDGTFGYSEKVTRAEMAAILVKLAGFSGEIEAAKNSDAAFTDVASHWSKGEVNVAFQHGLIAGVGDGKFNPDGNVTYGEVITMVMKLLGFGPVVDKTGVWPYNYINKASAKGIELYKSVAISATAAATRGDIAKITDNSLTSNVLIEDGYNADGKALYTEVDVNKKDSNGALVNFDQTLLSRVFEVVKFDKARVTSVPATSTTVEFADKIKVAGIAEDLTVPSGLVDNVNDLLNLEISGTKKLDKDTGKTSLISYTVETKSSNIINDTISKVTYSGSSISSIEFTKAGKKSVSAGASYTYNNNILATADASLLNTKADLSDAIRVTAVLDSDGLVSYVNAFQSANQSGTGVGVIKEKTSNTFKFYGNDTQDINFVDYKEAIAKKVSKVIVVKDGKITNLDALKVGDVVTEIYSGSKSRVGDTDVYPYLYVDASSKTIAGKKIDVVNGTTVDNAELVIDGVKYGVASSAAINLTTKIKDDCKKLSDPTYFKQLGMLLTETGNYTLNSNGEIAYVASVNVIGSSNKTQGLVVKIDSSSNIKNAAGNQSVKVTVLKIDGTTQEYILTEKANTPQLNDIVEYLITSKGEMDTDAGTVVLSKNLSGNSIYINTTLDGLASSAAATPTGYVNSSTVFFNRKGNAAADSNCVGNPDNYEIVKWEAVKTNHVTLPDDQSNASPSHAYIKDYVVKYAFVDSGTTLASTNEALVVSNGVDANGVYVKLLVGNNERQYKLAGGSVYATNGNFVKYTTAPGSSNSVILDSNGVDEKVYTNVYKTNGDVDGSSIALKALTVDTNAVNGWKDGSATNGVYAASDVVVYDATDKNAVKKISLSDIEKGAYIYIKRATIGSPATVIIKINKNDIKNVTDQDLSKT